MGMHSASVADVTRTARRASDSPAAHFLARTGLTARGVIYILVGWVALLVALGQSRRQQDMTATAMQHPAGRWLVGLAGLIIVICGLVLVAEGARRKFMKYLRTAQMSARMRRTAASSASHTPSANRPATRSATSQASRVLPAPPGPVTVTSRYSPSSPATSLTARPGR